MKHFDNESNATKKGTDGKQYKEKRSGMRKFYLIVAGQLISSIGSGLTDFGLAIYVLAMTKSVMSTAIVSVCAFLPSILMAPVGGVLADHYDRRVLMILGELLSGLGLGICLISVLSSHPSFVAICLGVGISSLFTALMEPAFKATITDLLSQEDYAKAGGLVQIAYNAKLLISPVIAGALLQITTVSTLLIIDIMTFFSTVIIFTVVKKGMRNLHMQRKGLSILQEMKEGATAIRGKKGITAVIGIMTIACFCIGLIQILSRPLVLAISGEMELGVLTTVIATGMLAGSIIISIRKNVRSYVGMLSLGLCGCGLFMMFIGAGENLILMAVFGFMMFVFMPAVQIAAEVLVRKNLDNEVQGRAFGLIGFITQLGQILAYLVSGALSDFVFEPFMSGKSFPAKAIGKIIGCGSGRGIALLIILGGVMLLTVGIVTGRLKQVKLLEGEKRNGTIMEACL